MASESSSINLILERHERTLRELEARIANQKESIDRLTTQRTTLIEAAQAAQRTAATVIDDGCLFPREHAIHADGALEEIVTLLDAALVAVK